MEMSRLLTPWHGGPGVSATSEGGGEELVGRGGRKVGHRSTLLSRGEVSSMLARATYMEINVGIGNGHVRCGTPPSMERIECFSWEQPCLVASVSQANN